MNESNSVKAIDRTNLTEQRKFRLDEISKVENYFYQEIKQRKSCSKKLSKYVAVFEYIDKFLIVSSAATGGVSLCLFTSVVRAPVTGIVKKLLSTTRNKKKSMIKFSCWLKLNSIAMKL